MTKKQFLFDSNSIYELIRETPQKALDKLMEGTTISLAYYELGNVLWRESLLLKRISFEEAEKALDLMYLILKNMQVPRPENEAEGQTLQIAHRFNLTFYDSAYLVEAKKSGKVLVTNDNKLAKTAGKLGVETLPSNALMYH